MGRCQDALTRSVFNSTCVRGFLRGGSVCPVSCKPGARTDLLEHWSQQYRQYGEQQAQGETRRCPELRAQFSQIGFYPVQPSGLLRGGRSLLRFLLWTSGIFFNTWYRSIVLMAIVYHYFPITLQEKFLPGVFVEVVLMGDVNSNSSTDFR